MKVYCFKCNHLNEESGRIPFKAICSRCGSDLHVCKTCDFYSPGKPNECTVPGTDYVRDREASNFCEEFSPHPHRQKNNQSQTALDKAKRIFGEDVPSKKNPFLNEEPHDN